MGTTRVVSMAAVVGGSVVTATVSDIGAVVIPQFVGGAVFSVKVFDLGAPVLASVVSGSLTSCVIIDSPSTVYPYSVFASFIGSSEMRAFAYADLSPSYFAVYVLPEGQIVLGGSEEGQLMTGGSAAGEIPWRNN